MGAGPDWVGEARGRPLLPPVGGEGTAQEAAARQPGDSPEPPDQHQRGAPEASCACRNRIRSSEATMPAPVDPAEAAEVLTALGWPVLPCHHAVERRCSCGDPSCASPAKHPRLRHGLHDATVEIALIRRWWRRWPAANLGIRTGAQPDGAGLVVLDIDPAAGGDASLTTLAGQHGDLSPTLEVRTGGGGRHLYFTHPGEHLPNSAGRLGPGLDVRGDGGYVLAPPSRHASGNQYQWVPRQLMPMPTWLIDLARDSAPEPHPTVPSTRTPLRRPDAWAAAALSREASNTRVAAEGHRNHTLNRSAFALGQLVASGHLPVDEVIATLTDAALAAGLSSREIQATIASGLRAGARSPRHPSTRRPAS